MLLRRERVIALRSKMMVLDVALLILAVRYFIERQIWNFRERVAQHLGRGLFVRLHLRDRILQHCNLGHQLFGLGFVFLFLGFADFLRRRVAACLRGFGLLDRRAARFVERDKPRRLRWKPTPRQRFVESVSVVANEADIVHDIFHRVMPGLVPGIHVFDPRRRKTWMAETSPAMTNQKYASSAL